MSKILRKEILRIQRKVASNSYGNASEVASVMDGELLSTRLHDVTLPSAAVCHVLLLSLESSAEETDAARTATPDNGGKLKQNVIKPGIVES